MWRLAKKRIALALTVPALFLFNSGAANATPIAFDFSGKLTSGEILGFSVSFDPLQSMTQIDQFTQVYSSTNVILNFGDQQFASKAAATIFQRDGTDRELLPDLWGFTSVLTEIGGNQTITITTQITDPSLNLIRPGVLISNTDVFFGSGLVSTLFLQGDNISSTGSVIAAVTRTAVSEPSVLFLFSIGLAAIGLAARRRAD